MKDQIHVLVMVAGLAIGEHLGGAERYGLELASKTKQEGVEPVVCAFWRYRTPDEQRWLEYLDQAHVDCFFALDRGPGFRPLRYLKALQNIRHHLSGRAIDVIHSHFQLGSVTALLLRLGMRQAILVRTAHGPVIREWRGTLLGKVCRTIFTRFLFPLCYHSEVGVSAEVVSSLNQRLIARLSRKKASFIPNTIDVDRFRLAGQAYTSVRQELGLSDADMVVGSVGRLSEQKGYRYLVDAAQNILDALPNTKFVIVGDGELMASLRHSISRRDLDHAFILTGARHDVERYYGAMDVFVLPSLWEGLPTVILESMASQVPVVVTDIPGNRDLVTRELTGFLVRARDPDDLCDTVIYVLRNPDLRRRVARQAYERIVPLYGMSSAAGRYMFLYKDLLSREREDHHNSRVAS